jgi:hypothetical protein
MTGLPDILSFHLDVMLDYIGGALEGRRHTARLILGAPQQPLSIPTPIFPRRLGRRAAPG